MGIDAVLHRIVRNEAMRHDPEEIYNWRVFALVFSSCFGGMLFGWETGAIGGILSMEGAQAVFGYTDKSDSAKSNLSQNIVSTLQAGCFVACFFTYWAADKFGRRICLIVTGCFAAVGVLFQAASSAHGTMPLMYIGRFVAGLGVGAASTLTPLYVSECAPRAIRGGLTAFYQLFIVLGIMISFWINYGATLHFSGAAVYVVPLSLQALPAICLIAGMTVSPESPRWCARQDDWERATSILTRLRNLPADSEYVSTEIQEMADQLEAERRLIGEASTWTLIKEMTLIPSNRKRGLISIFLMIFQQMTGTNAINYYAPQIFQSLGMSGTESSLFATGIYGVVKTAAIICFLLFVADTIGRRNSLLYTSVLLAIVMIIVAVYGKVEPPVEGQDISAFGYVAITCIYLWAALFQFGWGPACWILVSEIPTARLRAMNVAIGAATQWLFNFIIARTVLTMEDTMGTAGYGMFFMFAGFDFIAGIFVFFLVPETKGLSLEKMDDLFGLSETAKQLDEETADAERTTSIREDRAEVKT